MIHIFDSDDPMVKLDYIFDIVFSFSLHLFSIFHGPYHLFLHVTAPNKGFLSFHLIDKKIIDEVQLFYTRVQNPLMILFLILGSGSSFFVTIASTVFFHCLINSGSLVEKGKCNRPYKSINGNRASISVPRIN